MYYGEKLDFFNIIFSHTLLILKFTLDLFTKSDYISVFYLVLNHSDYFLSFFFFLDCTFLLGYNKLFNWIFYFIYWYNDAKRILYLSVIFKSDNLYIYSDVELAKNRILWNYSSLFHIITNQQWRFCSNFFYATTNLLINPTITNPVMNYIFPSTEISSAFRRAA